MIAFLKNNYKLKLLLLLFFMATACNTSQHHESKRGDNKIPKETVVDTIEKVKKTVPKKVVLDTVKQINNKQSNKQNKIISFDNHTLITQKGKRNILFQKTYIIDTKKNITLLKIDNDDDFLPSCQDPICAIIAIKKEKKIIKSIILPLIYEEDFNFLFKDKQKRYFFEFYSSPVGYTELYIIDTNTGKIYKTESIEETEKFIKKSFNFKEKTFQVKDTDNDKVKTKRFSMINNLKGTN